MKVLTGREASMYACFTDVVVAPTAAMPPVAATSATRAFDEALSVSPAFNRCGLRAAIVAIEMAPLALGYGKRLRRLTPDERRDVLDRLEHTRGIADAVKAVRSMAHMTYYGDDAVQRQLGYDPDAVVARAAVARAEAGRW